VNAHQTAGTITAAALIAAAVAEDHHRVAELADEAATAGHERETLTVLAGLAADYMYSLAHFQGQPIANLVDRLAGVVAEEVG
jgi:hypothetical protein